MESEDEDAAVFAALRAWAEDRDEVADSREISDPAKANSWSVLAGILLVSCPTVAVHAHFACSRRQRKECNSSERAEAGIFWWTRYAFKEKERK